MVLGPAHRPSQPAALPRNARVDEEQRQLRGSIRTQGRHQSHCASQRVQARQDPVARAHAHARRRPRREMPLAILFDQGNQRLRQTRQVGQGAMHHARPDGRIFGPPTGGRITDYHTQSTSNTEWYVLPPWRLRLRLMNMPRR